MDLALYLASPRHLAQVEEVLRVLDPRQLPNQVTFALLANWDTVEYRQHLISLAHLQQRWPQGIPFRRLYFGQEFCEHLIPTPEELLNAVCYARQLDWDFTYVTGYVTDAGLDKVRRNLACLAAEALDAEVVVNDWGVMRCLRADCPRFTPVLGRLLLKQLRLARYAGSEPPPMLGHGITSPPDEVRRHQLGALRGLNVSVAEYRQALLHFGVSRIDIDMTPQGAELGGIAADLRVSAHYPWSFVTGSRSCLTAAVCDPVREFVVLDSPCPRPCREINRAKMLSHFPQKTIQRGNAVFVFNHAFATPYLDGCIPVDRLVFAPYIPIG
jgi:hypothetical protein